MQHPARGNIPACPTQVFSPRRQGGLEKPSAAGNAELEGYAMSVMDGTPGACAHRDHAFTITPSRRGFLAGAAPAALALAAGSSLLPGPVELTDPDAAGLDDDAVLAVLAGELAAVHARLERLDAVADDPDFDHPLWAEYDRLIDRIMACRPKTGAGLGIKLRMVLARSETVGVCEAALGLAPFPDASHPADSMLWQIIAEVEGQAGRVRRPVAGEREV
jgi:hypothetical protein